MAVARRPGLEGLKRQLAAGRAQPLPRSDGYVRETFLLPREEARGKAREWFERWPKAAYWTEVESWRLAGGDSVEFTMRRLRNAD